jgi:hypothetical protein
LVALPSSIVPALLVGRGITANNNNSDSSNNNGNNTRSNNNSNFSRNNYSNTSSNNTNSKNLKNQSQKKYFAFNIKHQRRVFLELDCKERKNMCNVCKQ